MNPADGGRVEPDVDLLRVAAERPRPLRVLDVLALRDGRQPGGSPVQDSPPGSPGSPRAPVVTVVSSMGRPSWTSVARAVAATLPCFSHSTSTWAGSGRGARRKCALVAMGYGCGEESSTARRTVASRTPPFTAPAMAKRPSGRISYRPSPAGLTAMASSKALI
jgi:hypothetical protein